MALARGTTPLAVALCVLVAGCGDRSPKTSPPVEAAKLPPRPNVVVIETDDQDAASIAHMPNVQKLLVAKGTAFTNSFVSDSLCCPSRATFLTGQYAHNHHVLANRPPQGGWQRLRAANTLPVWLRRAGYRTGLVGKYLNGFASRQQALPPRPPGWTTFRALLEPAFRYEKVKLFDQDVLRKYPLGEYQTDVLTSKALAFLAAGTARRQPFFLWFTPAAPHEPATPAASDRGRFAGVRAPRRPSFDEGDVSDKPTFIRERQLLAANAADRIDSLYRQRLQTLAAVDRAVGRIVRTLEASGRLKRTVIVFTSDNGWMTGEHRLPEGKRVPYEESVRVPLVVRGPGFPARRRVVAPVANIDLAPTIASLARARPGLRVDGCSLLPLAQRGGVSWRRELLHENFAIHDLGAEADALESLPNYVGVRSGPYKYTEYADGQRELYDLRSDPYELDNRASDASLSAVRQDLARRVARLRTGPAPRCRLASATDH